MNYTSWPRWPKWMRRITVQDLARKEMEEAQKKLLEAETGLEYAQSMVDYRTKQVARLRTRIPELA